MPASRMQQQQAIGRRCMRVCVTSFKLLHNPCLPASLLPPSSSEAAHTRRSGCRHRGAACDAGGAPW